MSVNFEVKWYGDEILKAIEDGLPDALFEACLELGEAAKAKAPRGATGDLQESMYVATESKSTYKSKKIHRKEVKPPKGGAIVGFAAFYARYVEYGSQGHTVGKGGKVLRLASGDVVRGPIKHPGVRARPFLRPTIDEMQNRMAEKIAVELGKKLTK